MPCSPARLAANQRNALKSSGPRTPEGKERSRANALKHGMTGEGVVVPLEDIAEIDVVASKLIAELNPSGEAGRILLRQVAMMSTRLDRAARDDAARTAKRVRDAGKNRENARRAEIDDIISWINNDPDGAVPRLKQTPEGIDWLLRNWRIMKGELDSNRPTKAECPMMGGYDILLGRPIGELPLTEFSPVAKAIWGDFSGLTKEQKQGKTRAGLRKWARQRFGEMIDAEIEDLLDLRDEVDGEDEALDRAEAGERALFDPSKEGQLARKYEADAERRLFRALHEFQKIEKQAKADRQEAASTQPEVKPEPEVTPPTPPRKVAVAPPAARPVSSGKTNPMTGGGSPVVVAQKRSMSP